mmetsp:Transcript_12961/g.17350  ORF Transcript_12961/g.17350 Transcript_12961/m.17350 type:complete len:136 (-) Transcript_12961:144-551(-)
MIERLARWWFREFSERPVLASLYITGASIMCGTVCLNLQQSERVQSQLAVKRQAFEEDAARIPRLQMQLSAAKEASRLHAANLKQMIEETKTKTTSQKLDDAFDALYSFHTGHSSNRKTRNKMNHNDDDCHNREF